MIEVEEAIKLLQELIKTPSLSREEQGSAQIIGDYLTSKGETVHRSGNNVWCQSAKYDETKPTLLLNSHHDTVKPNLGYTRDPFEPTIEDGKLYGLGCNDAGGALVSLIATYLNYQKEADLKFNLVLACTAEEEISGANGIASLIPKLPKIDMAIIGEPSSMDMAIAEKGLMVLDCVAIGESGHAARNEGENAIYLAIEDIEWFKTYQFDQTSEMLGPIKMSTTLIEAGTQHNVVPDTCKFVVDVRTTDAYSNEATLAIIQAHTSTQVGARSTRLNPSGISLDHPLAVAGVKLGLQTYGSPTLSDQALLNMPSIKLGPGDSARSHTADEFIYVEQIKHGITTYVNLLEHLNGEL
jgi:acetylornithine deacetylase